MSHLILENDLTLSNSGAEWHGKALVKTSEEIQEMIKIDLSFPVLESFAEVEIDGEKVKLEDENGKGWKVILADCREMPENDARESHPANLVPLHVPKTGYEPLANNDFFESVENAFDKIGLPVIVSTAGTLGNLKQFYFSLEIESLKLTGGRGEMIKPFLSGITSHDGTQKPTWKDSFTRPVCANTVSAVLQEMSNLEISGKHTKNGILDFYESTQKAIESLFVGVSKLETEIFPRLQSTGVSDAEMRAVAGGYFLLPAMESGKKLADSVTFSTRASNAIEGIVDLARNGSGNNGETLYDLFNGATDYWSNGNGVGEKVGLSKRAYRSQFGSAAKHKTAFSEYLFDSDKVQAGREIGGKVLLETAKQN